jgi:hypothetical protein
MHGAMKGWRVMVAALQCFWRGPRMPPPPHALAADAAADHADLVRRLDASEQRLSQHEQARRVHLLALEAELPRHQGVHA